MRLRFANFVLDATERVLLRGDTSLSPGHDRGGSSCRSAAQRVSKRPPRTI